ncbi:hypothetical protein VTK73DRAFT_8768 [Phialemonium thermophilum]|uniref:Uncharacterized protein n=1 Tax=Phialemonium thermophilum TaxID=223376 RepID=A0ABR3W6N2_9PEZI
MAQDLSLRDQRTVAQSLGVVGSPRNPMRRSMCDDSGEMAGCNASFRTVGFLARAAVPTRRLSRLDRGYKKVDIYDLDFQLICARFRACGDPFVLAARFAVSHSSHYVMTAPRALPTVDGSAVALIRRRRPSTPSRIGGRAQPIGWRCRFSGASLPTLCL